MKRFTEYNKSGDAEIIGIDDEDLCAGINTLDGLDRLTAALNKLAAYEDIGLPPEDIKMMYKEYEVHK